ncbi:elongation factor G [Salisaeta longa]|uniref:elongation factor G n=1 Tax=Salisaeta longa TaxID=503170 RepID=UPI0003B63C85|nr:elongation factor G [Salisaeta longa]
MATYDGLHIRNIALAGHQDSGKTALAEAMLHASGAIERMGTIAEGTTRSDYHPSEQERQTSIFTSLLHADWHGHKINILDTPGYPDFVSEVIAAMKVADTAVYLMDARAGVQVGTELSWTYGAMTDTPAMFVINHLDHAEADFRMLVEQIKDRFGAGATVVQLPAGSGTRTVIDVLRMEQLYYPEGQSTPAVQPIDAAFQDEAQALHRDLVEDIAANDEALMELYFEKDNLTEDEMRDGLHAAMVERQLFPIFVTSATEQIGVSRLMHFITNVCPTPLDRPLATRDDASFVPDPDGPAAAFVYRTMSEAHVGSYAFVRVCNGSVRAGQDLHNARTGTAERLGTLYTLNGADRTPVDRLVTGDLGAIVKLKDTHTNDTLHDLSIDVAISPIEFPEPRYRMAVRAANGQEDKLARGLHQLTAEDPSLVVTHDPLLNQLTLSGQGQMHLDIAKQRLADRAGVEITFERPKIAYRETVRTDARATYRHKKQSGGAGQFADIALYLAPLSDTFDPPSDITVRDETTLTTDWDATVHFVDAIVGGVIDMRRFSGAIQKGVLDAMAEGPTAGFPVGDIRVAVYDGGMHPVDSNEAAFRAAAAAAFRRAFEDARPAVREPLFTLTVTTPDAYTGDVISDLNARRGRIQGMTVDGPFQKIEALIPEAELYQYATALRSITHGRGLHHARFSHYAQVPRDVQASLTDAHVAA